MGGQDEVINAIKRIAGPEARRILEAVPSQEHLDAEAARLRRVSAVSARMADRMQAGDMLGVAILLDEFGDAVHEVVHRIAESDARVDQAMRRDARGN